MQYTSLSELTKYLPQPENKEENITFASIFSEDVLNKLEINETKTLIKEYPFDIPSELSQKVYECRRLNKKESILYVISECNRLYELGEKSSYKYTIKSLSRLERGELEQWDYLESFFLSALTIKPDLGRYISKIVIKCFM